MALHQNDHIPVPVHSAIVMTAEQFNDLQAFLADLHGKSAQQSAAGLSEEQFAEMRRLLQPGFELSALMLADYKAQSGSAGPTTRSIMAEGLPENEWRTLEEINTGVPFEANRDEVRANRKERETETRALQDRQGRDIHRETFGGQEIERRGSDYGSESPNQAERDQGTQRETPMGQQGNTQGETERARVERLERESRDDNNRLV